MKRLRAYAPLRARSARAEALRPEIAAVYAAVDDRSAGQCETMLAPNVGGIAPLRCQRRAVDHHHVVKRSQGGPTDPDHVVALCRTCHERTDFPYSRGRLVIEALGAEQFRYEIRYAKKGRGPCESSD